MPDPTTLKRTKTLMELLSNEYGLSVHPGIDSGVVSVGGTVQKVLPNNPNRVGLTFINNSANTMYLNITNNYAAGQGIFLAGNGGSIALNWRDDMTLISNEWDAVCPGGASNLQILEVVTL